MVLMSCCTSAWSVVGFWSYFAIWLASWPMNDSGSVAKVRFMFGSAGLSSGPYGGLTDDMSLFDPVHGPMSVSFGSVSPVGSASLGCSAHCVSPVWPAIIAMALGVEGPNVVWWKLSNSVNRSAYCQ